MRSQQSAGWALGPGRPDSRGPSALRAAAFSFLLLVGAGCLADQGNAPGASAGVIAIPDEVACEGCRIELERLGLLGGPSDPSSVRDNAAGQGPGELGRQVRIWMGPGDTIFAQDDAQRRMTVFSPEGEFVRSFPVPDGNTSFARLTDGSFLYFARASLPDDPLFRHLEPDGQLRRLERG